MSRAALACIQLALVAACFAAAGWALPRLVEDWCGNAAQLMTRTAYAQSNEAPPPGGDR